MTELPLPPRVEHHEKGRVDYVVVQEWRREPTKKRTISIRRSVAYGAEVSTIRLALPPIMFLLHQTSWSNGYETHSNFQLHAFVEKIYNGARYLTGLPLPHIRHNGEVCLLPPSHSGTYGLEDLLVTFWGGEFIEEDYIMCESGSPEHRADRWRQKFLEWEKGPEYLTFRSWYQPKTNSFGLYEIMTVTPPFPTGE